MVRLLTGPSATVDKYEHPLLQTIYDKEEFEFLMRNTPCCFCSGNSTTWDLRDQITWVTNDMYLCHACSQHDPSFLQLMFH